MICWQPRENRQDSCGSAEGRASALYLGSRPNHADNRSEVCALGPERHDDVGSEYQASPAGITSATCAAGRQAGGVPTGTGICSRHLDLRCEQLRTEYDLHGTGERAIFCNLPAVLVCKHCGALCAECAEIVLCMWSDHKEAANV